MSVRALSTRLTSVLLYGVYFGLISFHVFSSGILLLQCGFDIFSFGFAAGFCVMGVVAFVFSFRRFFLGRLIFQNGGVCYGQ